MAEQLGLKESSYTCYERGETAITIDFLRKSSEILKVDPFTLLTVPPGSFLETGNHSPGAIVGNNNYQAMSDEQNKLMLRLIENVAALTERLLFLLAKDK